MLGAILGAVGRVGLGAAVKAEASVASKVATQVGHTAISAAQQAASQPRKEEPQQQAY